MSAFFFISSSLNIRDSEEQRPDFVQLIIMKRKYVEDSGYALSYVIPCHFHVGNKQEYLRTVGVPSKMRTRNLQNASHKH